MDLDRKIILENGQQFVGKAFGDQTNKICELVFNTSMVGYQELLSDPSYTDQAVVMTYPLIGNYGMAAEDYETDFPSIGALIVREYNDEPSNFRSTETLGAVMRKHGISGVSGVDTRKLARAIRNCGSQKVLLTDRSTTPEEGIAILRRTQLPRDAVSRVSCHKRWVSPVSDARFHVAAIDCGMKKNIVRTLNQCGCKVTVLPWNTTAAEIESLRPDGVFVSNGPGDPTDIEARVGCPIRYVSVGPERDAIILR